MKQRLARRLGIAAAMAVALPVAAMGLLHTRAARPLLARLGLHAGCPVSIAGVKAPQFDANRVKAAEALRGEAPAAARPALAFELNRSARADVLAWTSANGFVCTGELDHTALRCVGASDAPRARAAAARDVYFRFDLAGTLVAVDAMHDGASREAATASMDDVRARLRRDLGEPARTRSDLGSDPLTQSAVEYRFRDYAADVSATNFGDRGVIVREQYRAIPN